MPCLIDPSAWSLRFRVLALCLAALGLPGKQPRLLAFAVPGVGPGRWNLTKEQFQQLLAENVKTPGGRTIVETGPAWKTLWYEVESPSPKLAK